MNLTPNQIETSFQHFLAIQQTTFTLATTSLRFLPVAEAAGE